MNNSNKINWFPGHMAKTRREITESLKLVDLVVEIIDARIPISSRNLEIASLTNGKPKILVLNKTDLAPDHLLNLWKNFYSKQNMVCVLYSSKDASSRNRFMTTAKEVMKEKLDSWKRKGILGRKIRAMVLGIPNVGKSSFINHLCKNAKAKVENKPGVTKRNQWFSLGSEMELLDTPGVLWPNLDNQEIACNLAITGAIKNSILDLEDLAYFFIDKVKDENILTQRYKLTPEESQGTAYEILNYIGKKRGFLVSGGDVDTFKTSKMILEEFRNGKLGKIVLERPEV